jgi:hypothetical protein
MERLAMIAATSAAPTEPQTRPGNAGWVVIVFEDPASYPGEVAYVKGPFQLYEEAEDWMSDAEDCADGTCQITFIESPDPHSTMDDQPPPWNE